MGSINFTVPQSLEKRVSEVIKQKGFTSKAEFFRMAAIFLVDALGRPSDSDEKQFGLLARSLKSEISARYQSKKIPSLRAQLKNI